MAKHNVDIRIGATDNASKVFRRIAIAAGAFLSVRAISRFAVESAKAFIEQEKSTIKLRAALKATGNAAGFTQKQLSEYANELQSMTTIGNEAFESAMSVMATFRNISGATFKESIMLAADMSQALGTDLQGSVIQLGKALNDPILGITALNRVGITFSKTQKEQIKAFQDVNDMASAQAVILDELNNQFGGQAQAQADSFGGKIQQLANAWGDAKEGLGAYIGENETFLDSLDDTIFAIEHLTSVLEIMWTRTALQLVKTERAMEKIRGSRIAKWYQEQTSRISAPKVRVDRFGVPIGPLPAPKKESITGQIIDILEKELAERKTGLRDLLLEKRAAAAARRAAAAAVAAEAAVTKVKADVEEKQAAIKTAAGKRAGFKELVRAGAAFDFRELAGLDKSGREQRRDARKMARQMFLQATVGIRGPRRDRRDILSESAIRGGRIATGIRMGGARGTIEEQALQEQKKAAKRQANQERIQENIERLLTNINQKTGQQPMTNFN